MIAALRKIEGRGELPDVPSAVMEMCVDNPRSGFVDLFATHPPMDKRVKALVDFTGGHDPGPLALPPPAEPGEDEIAPDEPAQPGSADGDNFLPGRPPIALGEPRPSAEQPGPMGRAAQLIAP